MEGNLWKWTNYFSGWQPRWFVLENGILSYYRSKEDVVNGCKGSIKMAVCDVHVHTTDNTRLDLIIPSEAHFYVKAATAQERQEWLIALGSCKAGQPQGSSVLHHSSTGSTGSVSEVPEEQLKSKKSELRLYCDLLMQQVHSVKTSVQESDQPNIEALNEATSLLSATCDTFISTLDECVTLLNSSLPTTPTSATPHSLREGVGPPTPTKATYNRDRRSPYKGYSGAQRSASIDGANPYQSSDEEGRVRGFVPLRSSGNSGRGVSKSASSSGSTSGGGMRGNRHLSSPDANINSATSFQTNARESPSSDQFLSDASSGGENTFSTPQHSPTGGASSTSRNTSNHSNIQLNGNDCSSASSHHSYENSQPNGTINQLGRSNALLNLTTANTGDEMTGGSRRGGHDAVISTASGGDFFNKNNSKSHSLPISPADSTGSLKDVLLLDQEHHHFTNSKQINSIAAVSQQSAGNTYHDDHSPDKIQQLKKSLCLDTGLSTAANSSQFYNQQNTYAKPASMNNSVTPDDVFIRNGISPEGGGSRGSSPAAGRVSPVGGNGGGLVGSLTSGGVGRKSITSTAAEESVRDPIQTFFSAVECSFQDIKLFEDGGIPTTQFLAACKEIFPIFDKLNPTTFAPIKMEFIGNVRKIQQKYSMDPDHFISIQNIVLYEVKKGQHSNATSATVALLWLKRGLEFVREFLLEYMTGIQDLSQASNNAYGRSLRSFHSYVVRGVFALAAKSAPPRSEFSQSLATNPFHTKRANFEQILLRDMEEYITANDVFLKILNDFYTEFNLHSDEQI